MTDKLRSYFYFTLATIFAATSVVALVKLGDFLSGIFAAVNAIYWWAPLVWTPVLTVLVVYLIRSFIPDSAGTGSPHALIGTDPRLSRSLVDKFVSVKIALGKIIFTAMSFLSGLSLGNEGPAVQIGASIMHSFNEKIKWLAKVSAETLIMIGNGIGIAVCFGSVLGGFFYCVERMNDTFAKSSKTLTLLSMIVGSVIYAIFFTGGAHHFFTKAQELTSAAILPTLLVIVLGLVIGSIWSRALIFTINGNTVIGKFKTHRPLLFAGICGLIVAVIGVLVGGSVIGLSHSYTQSMFDPGIDYSYWFVPAKFLASVMTAWSGVSAGMFIPMINIGGGIGATVAHAISTPLTPTLVLFGMVTFLAVVSRAPICSVFIIVDLTSNYQLLLPLLIVSMVSAWCAKFVGPDLWQTQTNMLLSKFTPKQ